MTRKESKENAKKEMQKHLRTELLDDLGLNEAQIAYGMPDGYRLQVYTVIRHKTPQSTSTSYFVVDKNGRVQLIDWSLIKLCDFGSDDRHGGLKIAKSYDGGVHVNNRISKAIFGVPGLCRDNPL